ncbi:MAG: hypothetical protein V3R47_03450 [candidate division NC10 bacterium]
MRTITVFLAVVMLAVGSGYAIAADESPSATKGEIQKLVGTWKGVHGKNVEATYTFWMEQNRLLGKAKYFNIGKQLYTKGELSKINLNGNTLEFVVTYEQGLTGVFKLKLKGSRLKGRANKTDQAGRMREFGVSLKKSD